MAGTLAEASFTGAIAFFETKRDGLISTDTSFLAYLCIALIEMLIKVGAGAGDRGFIGQTCISRVAVGGPYFGFETAK